MTFPTPPSINLPLWADGGSAAFVEPDNTKKELGWVQVSGQNYGEIPPFKWFNWLQRSTGKWASYFNDAINYIKDGNLKQKIAIISQNTIIAIPGGSVLTFNTVNYINSTDTPWNTATGVFTIPVTGWYLFKLTGNPSFASSTTSYSYSIILFTNGLAGEFYLNGSSSTSLTFPVFFHESYKFLTAGDQITIKANLPSGNIGYDNSSQPLQLSVTWNF